MTFKQTHLDDYGATTSAPLFPTHMRPLFGTVANAYIVHMLFDVELLRSYSLCMCACVALAARFLMNCVLNKKDFADVATERPNKKGPQHSHCHHRYDI